MKIKGAKIRDTAHLDKTTLYQVPKSMRIMMEELQDDLTKDIVDDSNKTILSFVYDVKRTVGGKEVILHLVEQLRDSYIHKKSLTQYLEGYEEEQHMGVITGSFEKERIQETIEYIRGEIESLEKLPALIRMKNEQQNLKRQATLTIIEKFAQKQIDIGNQAYEFEVLMMNREKENYTYHLDVC